MMDFLNTLEQAAGIKDAAIELLPTMGVEREMYLDRIRVEIMAGGGPDVFLMAYHRTVINEATGQVEKTENLFEFPENAMEIGLFLPLDDYMENHTQYTEWDKQTQAVLAAGRNEEGQQIIPLAYTLPVIVYDKEEFEYTPTRELSWNDMLHDPELASYAHDLANCSEYYDLESMNGLPIYQTYLDYILGEIIDAENEELLFTEEELLQRINEILALGMDDVHDDPEHDYYSGIEEALGTGLWIQSYKKPLTMIPMYSDDGGVTARITAYAAVNRNTKHPEEAFTVIDVLMSERVQQNNRLYVSSCLRAGGVSMPMHEDLFQKDTAGNHGMYYLTDENYQELCEVRDQITGANFDGRSVRIINSLMQKVHRIERNNEPSDKTVEELVHEAYVDLQRRVRE
ncbi:MAG: extracellular solute-binding protein [Clostridia bacterium]|nr:extracellular solute-binding protein [Clostridia bacterium]